MDQRQGFIDISVGLLFLLGVDLGDLEMVTQALIDFLSWRSDPDGVKHHTVPFLDWAGRSSRENFVGKGPAVPFMIRRF
jgi:hypothetical protein